MNRTSETCGLWQENLNISVTRGVLDGEKKEDVSEKVFENIVAKNCPNFAKDVHIWILEAGRTFTIFDSHEGLQSVNSFSFPLSFSCSAIILWFHFSDLHHIFSYFNSRLIALLPVSILKDKGYQKLYNSLSLFSQHREANAREEHIDAIKYKKFQAPNKCSFFWKLSPR